MNNNWIKIEDEVPPEGVNLLYFFDCTGISLGQYYGIEPDYCPETGHVFASHNGWLTGDVTHWMPLPDVPEGAYEEGWEMVEVEDAEERDIPSEMCQDLLNLAEKKGNRHAPATKQAVEQTSDD